MDEFDELIKDWPINIKSIFHQQFNAFKFLVQAINDICPPETNKAILIRFQELVQLYKNSDPVE